MIENTLKSIGLTQGEISVYLSLLELGSSSVGNIIKKSRVSGSKVYEVLDRLMIKGLTSNVEKNGIKYFEASDPNKIMDYLNDKKIRIEEEKSEISKIIPQLILKRKHAPESKVKVFTGFEGLKTANEDIIRNLKKGEEWLSMGLTEQPKSWEIYFNKKQIERSNKGIIIKHLINEKYRMLQTERKNLPYTEFKFLPKNFEMPTSTDIYQNKVMIMILLQEDPMAIIIESKAVADSFRKYFYALWIKQTK